MSNIPQKVLKRLKHLVVAEAAGASPLDSLPQRRFLKALFLTKTDPHEIELFTVNYHIADITSNELQLWFDNLKDHPTIKAWDWNSPPPPEVIKLLELENYWDFLKPEGKVKFELSKTKTVDLLDEIEDKILFGAGGLVRLLVDIYTIRGLPSVKLSQAIRSYLTIVVNPKIIEAYKDLFWDLSAYGSKALTKYIETLLPGNLPAGASKSIYLEALREKDDGLLLLKLGVIPGEIPKNMADNVVSTAYHCLMRLLMPTDDPMQDAKKYPACERLANIVSVFLPYSSLEHERNQELAEAKEHIRGIEIQPTKEELPYIEVEGEENKEPEKD